ncbi:MAG: TetR/AcrR family transcriptional regulator [Bacteroidales bacterium]
MTKREQVLQTTLELITELGFHATPMALIIEKSGVAAGTIYYYFKSKEELIDTLYADIKKEIASIMVDGLENESNYKLKFALIWNNLFLYFNQYPKKFEFFQQYSNSPLIRKEIKELNKIHYSKIFDYLETGKSLGIIRDLPLVILLNLIICNIAVLVTLSLNQEVELSEQIVANTINACWDSIKTN